MEILTLSPSYRPVPPSGAPPLTARKRLPRFPLTALYRPPVKTVCLDNFTYCAHKTMTLHTMTLSTMFTNNFCHVSRFHSRISGLFVQFWLSLGLHSFKFRRVLTAAWQQWMRDSDSELNFDSFLTVEFGENGHFAAALGSGNDVN